MYITHAFGCRISASAQDHHDHSKIFAATTVYILTKYSPYLAAHIKAD